MRRRGPSERDDRGAALSESRPLLSLDASADGDIQTVLLLSAMRDTRGRTLRSLKELPVDHLEASLDGEPNTISTLLYHVALIEADWLYDDILGTQDTDWPSDLFPVDHRDAEGVLSPPPSETLADHIGRLKKVRAAFVANIAPMSATDLHKPRAREGYDVTPAWVMNHLMQHEAEHRSQIDRIRERLGADR